MDNKDTKPGRRKLTTECFDAADTISHNLQAVEEKVAELHKQLKGPQPPSPTAETASAPRTIGDDGFLLTLISQLQRLKERTFTLAKMLEDISIEF